MKNQTLFNWFIASYIIMFLYIIAPEIELFATISGSIMIVTTIIAGLKLKKSNPFLSNLAFINFVMYILAFLTTALDFATILALSVIVINIWQSVVIYKKIK